MKQGDVINRWIEYTKVLYDDERVKVKVPFLAQGLLRKRSRLLSQAGNHTVTATVHELRSTNEDPINAQVIPIANALQSASSFTANHSNRIVAHSKCHTTTAAWHLPGSDRFDYRRSQNCMENVNSRTVYAL